MVHISVIKKHLYIQLLKQGDESFLVQCNCLGAPSCLLTTVPCHELFLTYKPAKLWIRDCIRICFLIKKSRFGITGSQQT